jgi:molecular chaperone HscC
MSAPIIGIDLGTTYSLVAVMQGRQPVVLPNALGEKLTPSAVSVDGEGATWVGAAARARAPLNPERSALSFKRDMGTDRLYELGGKSFKPQELSALVLAALKRDAEVALGTTVEEAVITVPAYFGDLQRQATRDAGLIAGLKVERIINEPTAAALAYGLHEGHRTLRAAVLDLGGGTFDVTVLQITEGVIEIQSSAADARLGGDDFDDALARWVVEQSKKESGVDLSTGVPWARLRDACELAKRRLTSETDTAIVLPDLAVAGGKTFTLERRLARAQAEELWLPLLERVRAPILRALRDAGIEPSAIDEVLLVGGSTRMPCMFGLAAKLFGRMPLRTLPPDEAIAQGAAVQAALKLGAAAVEDLVVTDVAPFTLGIATTAHFGGQAVHGLYSPLIERGTVIPVSREKRFSTVVDGQTSIVIEVYQGEHAHCSQNQKLGDYRVKGLPPKPAGEVPLDVRFTYDLNGILEVEMTVAATGKKESFAIEQRPGSMTAEQVAQARKSMERLKFHPRDALPNTTAMARGDALFVELTGDKRELLGQALAAFRAALESQDAERIENARASLTVLTAQLRAG